MDRVPPCVSYIAVVNTSGRVHITRIGGTGRKAFTIIIVPSCFFADVRLQKCRQSMEMSMGHGANAKKNVIPHSIQSFCWVRQCRESTGVSTFREPSRRADYKRKLHIIKSQKNGALSDLYFSLFWLLFCRQSTKQPPRWRGWPKAVG